MRVEGLLIHRHFSETSSITTVRNKDRIVAETTMASYGVQQSTLYLALESYKALVGHKIGRHTYEPRRSIGNAY